MWYITVIGTSCAVASYFKMVGNCASHSFSDDALFFALDVALLNDSI